MDKNCLNTENQSCFLHKASTMLQLFAQDVLFGIVKHLPLVWTYVKFQVKLQKCAFLK